MSYSQLPLRLRIYIAASAAAAALAAAYAARGHEVQDWKLFLGLLAVATLAGALKVELPISFGRMSLGSVVTFFALFCLDVPEAIAVNCMSAVAGTCCKRVDGVTRFDLCRIPVYRMVFNLANHALSAAAAGWAFRQAAGVERNISPVDMAVPIGIAAG